MHSTYLRKMYLENTVLQTPAACSMDGTPVDLREHSTFPACFVSALEDHHRAVEVDLHAGARLLARGR